MSPPRINAGVVDELGKFDRRPRAVQMSWLPERVLQFGEGAFLRGFVDWMIDRLNRIGLFNGRVVVVQPLPRGTVEKLNEQDGIYTLVLRGLQDGAIVETRQVINSISRGINPYRDYATFLKCAENPELRFIVSNTTEAGIVFNPADRLADAPPPSFPGKLTALLHARFRKFDGAADRGLVLLPCELVERNGERLKTCVLQTADAWHLGTQFVEWVEHANHFTNTLVDRIVTGYPADEAPALFRQLGYEDALLDVGEIDHTWVIEGPEHLSQELPFHTAGLNVIWTADVTPYRDRKVRILNGAHTMTAPAAFVAGLHTVKELVGNAVVLQFLRQGIEQEIIPTLDLPRLELETFAAAVLNRFANPYIRHQLLNIAANSTSKFRARVMPSIQQYLAQRGSLPRRLTFSLAGLIAFYRGTEIREGSLIGRRDGTDYPILDEPAVLEVFCRAWRAFEPTRAGAQALVMTLLGQEAIWGNDLNRVPGFTSAVARDLHEIITRGPLQAMQETG
jgi:tagaturonate reductase